jgi:uncharacterized protein with HEPN domain
MSDPELAREILSQILEAAQRIVRRSATIQSPGDLLSSEAGQERLDGICMLLIAIGESLKNLDKVTGGELLKQYPQVDWDKAKGIRDVISHHYFKLNHVVVYNVCKDKMPGLIEAVKAMKKAIS